jgi:hypothetical protein
MDFNRKPHDYVVNPAAAVGAGLSVPVPLTIDADFDFEWIELVSTQTGTFTAQVRDSGTGKDFQSAAVNNANWSGTAQLPKVLPEPFVIPASRTLLFTLTDTSGAPNTIQIVLRGYKLQPVAAAT